MAAETACDEQRADARFEEIEIAFGGYWFPN
jgi:hypothetical protein